MDMNTRAQHVAHPLCIRILSKGQTAEIRRLLIPTFNYKMSTNLQHARTQILSRESNVKHGSVEFKVGD
jgi:hypothetical protein